MVKSALEGVEPGNQQAQHALIKDVGAVVFIGLIDLFFSSPMFYAHNELHVGGYATISAVLHTFFLAMTCFPDVQVNAQEELDRVVGKNRLPEFSDEVRLPYLAALLREIYR